MPPLEIFVHIPKTGGTSLREAAARHYGERRMLYDYGAHSAQTSALVQDWVYRRRNLAGFADAVKDGPYRFLAGHFHRVKYDRVLPDARYLTWMRDPRQRLWSMYRHFVRHKGYTDTFEAFYRDERFLNQQSRIMNGSTEGFEFVGVLEHYRESLRGLERAVGLRLEERKANRAPADDVPGLPTEEDWANIEALHGDDAALYAVAASRFERRGWRQRLRRLAPPGPWNG